MEPISVWAVPERATHAAEARRNPERWWAEGSIWTDRLVSALATASKEQIGNAPSLLMSGSPSGTACEPARHSRCGKQRLESRMRENRVRFGGRGGVQPFPTPINVTF